MANDKIQEPKKNKVLEILRKEYPFERVLLGILGTLVIVLGVYLVAENGIEIKLTTWWIFNSPLKRTLFSVFVILIGVAALLMALWPFFVPSFKEMKKVHWPKRNTILNHSARVFGFILFLVGFFILVNWPLLKLFAWING